jgi:nucleotide-binding universal stress UspA family protein
METIAVFVNESGEAKASVEFGAREAAIRQARLRLIAAWEVPQSMLGSGVAQREVFDEFRESAEALLDEAAARVAELYPELEVEKRAVKGQPGPVFVEESRDASLAVAARRPQGPLRELMVGSISKYILRNSHIPVVVIPFLPPQK